jgi:hypothetical protein
MVFPVVHESNQDNRDLYNKIKICLMMFQLKIPLCGHPSRPARIDNLLFHSVGKNRTNRAVNG